MFKNRVEKARKLANSIRQIPGTNKASYGMYGSQGDNYQVSLSRSGTGSFTHKNGKGSFTHKNGKVTHYYIVKCECAKVAAYDNGQAMEDCLGNSKTVCYHCIAAFIYSFHKMQVKITFHNDKIKALKKLNLGGSLFCLTSAGFSSVWAVVQKKDAGKIKDNSKSINTVSKMSNEQRVNILRNTREESEGID